MPPVSDQLVGHRDGFFVRAAPNGQLDAQYLERPLVPSHGLRAVRAVRVARLPQVFAGALVRAAHQVNLRERVEDGARRLLELHRAADLESARQHLLGALEVAKLHEDLAERRERHGEAVTGCRATDAALTLRSASASAWSWWCRISATFAWLWTMPASTSSA